jgi:type III restriction enzyme
VKIKLKDFQDKAVRRCVQDINIAFDRFADDGDLTAVLLNAPTGSGKTVVSTATIESILDGSADGPERPTLRVLWLTDSPSLNKQSADKMDRHSDFLREGKNLVVVDESFDEPELLPGVVHFAHIQQLTKSASSWWPNEAKNRKTALWHAIARTISEHGDDFLLIVDEAHKGIGKNRSDKDRDTIIKTVLEGGVNLFDGAPQPPAPVGLVMTATPENFVKAMAASDRIRREVKVSIRAVQASGLLKKRVRVDLAEDNPKAVHTLLESGIDDLHTSQTWWQEAHDTIGVPLVIPVMVVQVENSISVVELGERIKTIADRWSTLTGTALPEKAFAHSFGEGVDLKAPGGLLRHIEPNLIDSDSFVRVVFFKEALTTGWDCPRAEVMVSLRAATDPTVISQLVGRMVRNPLAQPADDLRLDSVDLYLPFYNTAVVNKVVSQIALDTEGAVDVELKTHLSARNPQVSDETYAKLDRLPKYIRPAQDYKNNVQRAADLAERLVDRGVVTIGAEDEETPEDHLRAGIVNEIARLDSASKGAVDKRVEGLLKLDTLRRSLTYAVTPDGDEKESERRSREIHFRDLDAFYADACRRLPEGSGAWYYEHLVHQGMPGRKAKMRVAAVAELPDIKGCLNTVAAEQIEELRKLYEDRVESRGLAVQFKMIWFPPTQPVPTELVLDSPAKVATQRASKKGNEVVIEDLPLLEHHVFAFESPEGKYLYPGSPNSWEAAALALELASPTVTAWFRNPNSGKTALSVPYFVNGKLELMHPDFLFVHDISGELFVDIIDPHLDYGDARDKWTGLATYAAEHADRIRRAIAVIRIGATDWGLNLSKPEVRKALADSTQSLEDIFEKYGNKRIKS